eukprot:gene5595-10800_t
MGEARSRVTQTRALVGNSRTKFLARGSPAFMAPEISVEEFMTNYLELQSDHYQRIRKMFCENLCYDPDQRCTVKELIKQSEDANDLSSFCIERKWHECNKYGPGIHRGVGTNITTTERRHQRLCFPFVGNYRSFAETEIKWHLILLYNEDPTLPIYAKGRSQPCSTAEVAELLIIGVKSELICANTPIYVKNNVEFVVDANSLNDWRDIRADMNCGLQRSGTKSFHFDFSEGKAFTAYKSNSTHVATRYLYVHKTNSDFHKVIVSVKHLESDKTLPLFYVQFYFNDGEHQIEFDFQRAGKGSKKNVRQTKFSVRAEMK